MPTYIDRDGVPASADPSLLTDLLRDELGFDGVVVSDYFAVSFLQLQHGSRPTWPARRRWRSRPGLTWSCRAPAATATRCWRRSPPATCPRS